MTITRPTDNVHRSFDCDYTVQHDARSHHHVAEASRLGYLLKPRMDVFEDPDTNMVTATLEIPGVSKDKVAINVSDNRLTISGEVASYFGPNCGYILHERRTGPFGRTLQLPANIPAEAIRAVLEDGVLTVSFPRLPPEGRHRRASVSPRITEPELASRHY